MKYWKRSISAIAGAALVFAGVMPVSAQTSLEKAATVEGADLLYGSNNLTLEGESGYALADMAGTPLTEAVYGSFSYNGGYIVATGAEGGLTSTGVLTAEGKELVPCRYSEIEVLNPHWILAITLDEATADQYDYSSFLSNDAFYLINTVDVYFISQDKEASCVASLTRDQYLDSSAYGEYINIQDRATNGITAYDSAFQPVATDLSYIYDEPVDGDGLVTFSSNGQYGLQDAQGNTVMEPSFQYIYDFYRDYAVVSTGEKEGLIDREGNVVLPAEFDEVELNYYLPEDPESESTSGYGAFGYFSVIQDGKAGFADETGAITCEPKYVADAVENCGISLLMTDAQGNVSIIAADGAETLIEGYDDVSALYYGSGLLYEVRNTDYQEGLIDWHGNVLLPCEYGDISLSADGNYAVTDNYDGYIDVYKLAFDQDGANAETEAPAETEASAETEGVGTETAAGTGSTDTISAVNVLLDNAEAALNEDPEGGRESAAGLLASAASLLEGENADAAALLNNAVSLLNMENTDADSILVLIANAREQIA